MSKNSKTVVAKPAAKKAEAVKLLNERYQKHYAEALALLRDIAADAAANPPQGEKTPADL